MDDRLALTDGPYFHSERPLGLHPALRAAAHLLSAAHGVARSLMADLRDELLPRHPPTVRRLLSRRRPSSATASYLDHLRRWAADHHLASPYVLEVLALTLASWHDEDERRRIGAPVWSGSDLGPWLDTLSAEPAEADVSALLATLGEFPHLRVPRRPPPDLSLAVRGWDPETEPFEVVERRLRRALAHLATEHRTRTQRRTRSSSLRGLRLRPARRHFTWLARRQLQGWRPVQIARRYKVSSTSVHRALRPLADLLELDLRPVKTGRPGL